MPATRMTEVSAQKEHRLLPNTWSTKMQKAFMYAVLRRVYLSEQEEQAHSGKCDEDCKGKITVIARSLQQYGRQPGACSSRSSESLELMPSLLSRLFISFFRIMRSRSTGMISAAQLQIQTLLFTISRSLQVWRWASHFIKKCWKSKCDRCKNSSMPVQDYSDFQGCKGATLLPSTVRMNSSFPDVSSAQTAGSAVPMPLCLSCSLQQTRRQYTGKEIQYKMTASSMQCAPVTATCGAVMKEI